jgi:hypothetical protein
MNRVEREEYLERRSRELAESGQYRTYAEIEVQLVHVEGLPEARSFLDSPGRRDYLNAICTRAQGAANA